MSILVIVVYILLFKKIIEILSSVDKGKALSYISVLDPGIKILDTLLSYIGWVLLGALIAFGLRHYFKKRLK